MYDRAPRVLPLSTGCTSPHLGPGSYDLPSRSRQSRGGYAPFLSLASRGLEIDFQNSENALPGPGSYDIVKPQKIVKGGQSPQYKEKRFREVRCETPGPGTYCQPLSLGQEKEKEKPPPRVPSAQRIASCIKILRTIEAPSIPSQRQAFGYEEAEDGTLKKYSAPEKDDTLGPAYYQTVYNEAYPTMKYKGVHFGKLTERRHKFKPQEGPGPADYYVIPEDIVHYENINLRMEDRKKGVLCVPRYHEKIILQEEKKGVPGPGQYDIKSQFEQADTAAQSEVLRAPFLSLSKRFVPVKSSTPPPGTYNETRSSLEYLNKSFRTKSIPFGYNSVRFTQDSRMLKTPGPAFYNVINYNIATPRLKEAFMEKTQKGAFGSSAPRLFYCVNKEAFTTPGPADYQVKQTTEDPHKKKRQLSVFLSAIKRIPVSRSEAPPPGSYDVHKSFEKSQCKCNFMPPRTVAAKRKHASFLSGTCRELVPKPAMNMPGPGTYSPMSKWQSSVTVCVSKVERFKEAKDGTPGPASYELSPFLRDTVLKRTFNATLNNPVVPVASSISEPLTNKKALSSAPNEVNLKNNMKP